MTALPYDVTRCRPQVASIQCANCKRWADHPEQVFGSITPLVNATGPRDPACVYVPISLVPEAA
jgi:hypothetical protein